MLKDTADVPLVSAAQNVLTVAVTADNRIKSPRQRAFGRCLSVDRVGVYRQSENMRGGRESRCEAD